MNAWPAASADHETAENFSAPFPANRMTVT
jgi:hypothetical protein